ncbi:DNA repair protein RecO [Candidatus Saccharibacteria bacterium]|nr:MAG: DNA repair protein RecO [Candidatus Saccharibacteria bacterium]
MIQKKTAAIILKRIDYGEADRILTVLTPDVGKLSLIAKGVRKVKSKLAGGIELLSTSEISYIPGRGSVSTLVSSRLIRYYGQIIQNIDRTMLAYELIKLLDKVTEDQPEASYYELLEQAFCVLDDKNVSVDFIRAWFSAQLLRLAGHTPNLQTSAQGQKLSVSQRYDFDYDSTAFTPRDEGTFGANEIKYVRLLFSANRAETIALVQGGDELAPFCAPLIQTLRQLHLRV